MSKKNIISDFSALKGKVTFSEHICDVPEPAKVPEKQPAANGNRNGFLKVGQSVVLMDASLRGKIVNLGKKVSIELEDGLLIEAAYGEFAVTDDAEISSLKHTKVKAQKGGQVLKKSHPPFKPGADGTITVDLHIEAIPGGRNVPKGQQLQFQLETFRRIIRANLSHKGMKITFIHGIGDGTLKSAIRKELDEVLALTCTYSIGVPALTIVTIR